MTAATENLFSYGTLRDTKVQMAVFGRLVDGAADAITGYRLRPIKITDARTIALSGKDEHTILERTDAATDEVPGVALCVTQAELLLADAYEPPGYKRVAVRLRSGGQAWVYVEG